MKYLITGCSGFFGFHLAESLLAEGHQVYGTCHQKKILLPDVKPLSCDFSNRGSVQEAVAQSRPGMVYHLAAQSGIVASWKDFEGTFATNVYGTYYLLEAIREQKLNCRILIIGSSSEYGSLLNGSTRHDEEARLKPASPYALSKTSQDLMAQMYYDVFHMPVIRVLPFYVIGPRKEPDAPSDFAKAIVRHERGELEQLTVGNLNVVRDVVDIRDAIRALRLIEAKGLPGTSYNLCSGKGTKLQAVMDGLLELSRSRLKIIVDSNKFRPGDDSRIVGNSKRLRKLGWSPLFTLKETLLTILNYWKRPA